MSVAYVDTSWLVAIALGEPGHVEAAERLASCERVVASNLLEAELRSVFKREKLRADPGDFLAPVQWVLPARPLSAECRRVLDVGYVRGADLWHLACALYIDATAAGLSFFTLDDNQRDVAQKLGFQCT